METPMSKPVQAGPLPVISRVITQLIEVITCYNPSYPCVRPITGVITPFMDLFLLRVAHY